MANNKLAPQSKNKLPWYEQALPMEGRATFLPFQDTLPGSVMNTRSWALPGIIAGAANAITAPGRAYSGSDPTFNPEEEAANFAMNVMGGGMGASRAAPAPAGSLGMNAFHRTAIPFEGNFARNRPQSQASFSGPEGFYFSRWSKDPTTAVFGRNVIQADVKVTNPAPVSQVSLGIGNHTTPRAVLPVTPVWAKLNNIDPKQGGYVIANSAADAIAGNTVRRPSTYAEYEQQFYTALMDKKVFKLVNPEILQPSDVSLLKLHGYNGFEYKRPQNATSSMPSQIVALDPEQIVRKAAWTEPK
jgi:hypothetical protein